MGIVERIKSIMSWESAVTLIFFFACLTAIGIIGIVYDNMVVYVGVLVALGIPTSIFGNLAASARIPVIAPIATANTNSSSPKQKDIDDLRICLAETRNELLLLKTKVGENNHE